MTCFSLLETLADRSTSMSSSEYQTACAETDWSCERSVLIASTGMTNLSALATDYQLERGRGELAALLWHGAGTEKRVLSYGELTRLSNKFANVLRKLKIDKNETVFYLGERVPEIFYVLLGSLKNNSVFCPLFASFGPEPVKHRLNQGNVAVLVTTSLHYERKIIPIAAEISPRYVLLVDIESHAEKSGGQVLWSLVQLLKEADENWSQPLTAKDDPALLHFTSGTTGFPKGALIPHGAAVSHIVTGRYVFNLKPKDVFWCTADPGWVTGSVYSILTPLLLGATTLLDREDFDGVRWFELLERERVNVLYTSPSAIRRLQRMDDDFWSQKKFPYLRSIHSVGEPLDAAIVRWGQERFGMLVYDSWWQTETGAIMIANVPGMPMKPGSMGRPVPGIEAEIIDPQTCKAVKTGKIGILALRTGWPSEFLSYIHESERYDRCYDGTWYLTGDFASKDEDGFFWFQGRADDLIKSAGHLIGPFEVEVVLNSHPEVLESAVFGIPDRFLGQRVAAAIVLAKGNTDYTQLQQSLVGFARSCLGPAVAPRHITFVTELPKNRAGKIMRRVVRAQYLGETQGDLSTLDAATGQDLKTAQSSSSGS